MIEKKNRKYTCDSDYFKDINTEEKAYWFGFICADGYIKNSAKTTKMFGISLQLADKKHLEKLKIALNSNHIIREYAASGGYKVGTKYCRLHIQNDKLARDLISHGCVEHKSNVLKPPADLDEHLAKHFIRGYMDGNGSITICNTPDGPSYKIRFTGTDDMLIWIMKHLIDHQIIKRQYPLTKRRDGQVVSNIEFGGNILSQKFLDYIYDQATVWLDRKYKRYQDLIVLNSTKRRRHEELYGLSSA